ncbi:uncharacterized protein TNCV_1110191 [Trichonephila clavipes]|nr:uncharacterized protein TNCV_1110191 [Trichonephila clavipes]
MVGSSIDLSSFRALGAENLQAPLALEDRNLSTENLLKSSLSGPLSARLKRSMDKPALGPGLRSNPREGRDACKCIVPSRDGGTLNSRRTTSPLVRLMEGEERCKASDNPQGVLHQNWGGNKPNRSITCMVQSYA